MLNPDFHISDLADYYYFESTSDVLEPVSSILKRYIGIRINRL